jgi:hypothetical protein
MPDNASYRPGDLVPRSGIYNVDHDPHRLMHMATLLRDTVFPDRKRCKNAVSFIMLRPVNDSQVLPFRSSELLEEYQDPESLSA